ncbi:MAG TPA: sugar ABC transporter substrate-binding protein [Actinomycetota bacterium]|jgi:D-xylose transport system substrate-binding protein|nr:sugar ABC transporter substrate-binding protein [Actinomycetota bacterium]
MPTARRMGRAASLAVTVAVVVLLAASCSTSNSGGGGGSASSAKAKRIALLLPESKTTRYEAQDRPLFEAKVKALCPDCQIQYSNANQDAAAQQNQADAALTNGAQVMVLDPVDSTSAASIVAKAKARNVPVISYDRLILDADVSYYISFDNLEVGKLQARSLVGKLKAEGKGSGTIVMVNGAPTDNNAKLFKQGAHSVIDASGLKIGKEYDTPDWSPDQAQTEMEQAITALGQNGFAGVYAANDGTAGGAIAAMKGQGISPSTRPTTGQDAELAAVQRILDGEQYMTVYKAIKPEAEQAAELAVDLVNGDRSAANGLAKKTTANGTKNVPSIILTPVAVTKANAKQTIGQMISDRFLKVSDICSGPAASACRQLGLSQ